MTLSSPFTGATQAVLAALTALGSANPTELSKHVVYSRRRVSDVLAAARGQGLVEKASDGRYFALEGADPLVTASVGAPAGWGSARLELDGNEGTAVSGPVESDNPDEVELLGIWKLDPAVWQIEGPLRTSAWQTFSGEWLHSYRAHLVRRTADVDTADVDALLARARKVKLRTTPASQGAETFIVCLSDWQIGKGEGGGSEATVERVMQKIEAAVTRLRELRKMGREIGTVFIVGMGDIVEGCAGHYAMQTFSVDLDRRSQVRVARELVLTCVSTFAALADRVIVGCVPGNHGENRNHKGKAFTTFADNDDVAVFETVAFVCEQSETLRHVQFLIPDDDLTITVDLGVRVGVAHGHQFTKGAVPAAKAEEWLKGQALGNKPVGYADILLSGHYHHFCAAELGPRVWFQTPALDGGSKWFDDTSGKNSPAGLLTLVVGTGGWRDLQVL